MLNISEVAKDTAIVSMKGKEETVPSFQMVPLSMILSDL